MKIEDFIESIERHQSLRCEGISMADRPEGDFLLVADTASGVRYRVLATAVREQAWPVLEAILTGKRNPVIMDHVTRIVGYYSKVRNWNKSKLGELRDRKEGNYRVGGGEWDAAEKPARGERAETAPAEAACAAV